MITTFDIYTFSIQKLQVGNIQLQVRNTQLQNETFNKHSLNQKIMMPIKLKVSPTICLSFCFVNLSEHLNVCKLSQY